MARYVIEVMYDGTLFHGSQLQGETPTVQLYINNTLTLLLHIPILSYGASRTDEGVHAYCNYYHFDTEIVLNPDFLYKCNAILPTGIAFKKISIASNSDFNVRFDAVSRRYRYRIYTKKNPFLLNRAYYFPLKMDVNMLDEIATIIPEYSNFESFSKRNTQAKTFMCTIFNSYWEHKDNELNYIVEANRFLRGMVRGLVGTQIQMARGKGSLDEFKKIIEAQNCTKAYFNVPGHGLYLEEIKYKTDSLKPFL